MNQADLRDDSVVNEVDEQLVAYLDGELPPEEIREVERKLADDALLRKRLRELQNGWQMLDELPLATSSQLLVETTMRLAAVDAKTSLVKDVPATPLSRFGPLIGLALATAVCLMVGIGVVRAQDAWRYRKQLRDLPTAMHLDAYLHATDIELMTAVVKMPEWKQAIDTADRLGVWDFSLVKQIDAATASQREALLPTLPIESQQVIRAAWDRFENVAPKDRGAVIDQATAIAGRDDSAEMLETMDRFAAWSQSLPAEKRDLLAKGSLVERQAVIRDELQSTTRSWTRDRGRALTDGEVEVIYAEVRHIARMRVETARRESGPEVRSALDAFGFGSQPLVPQVEATFLRRLIDPKYGPPGRRDGNPSPMLGGDSGSAFALMRRVIDRIRGPLRDDELYMLMSALPENLLDLIDAAAEIPNLQEGLLRSWAEESVRRMQWNRSGQTVSERYQSREPDEREAIDLLPTDQLLRALQSENRR